LCLREPPCRIILIQLKRTLEAGHDYLQFAWKPKRATEVCFNGRTRYDTASWHQNSYVSASVDDHDILIQVFDRGNDRMSDGSRLENGSDAIIDFWFLATHSRFSLSAAPSAGLGSSRLRRMSLLSILTENTCKQAL
jgi:hypothetical protein